MADSDFDYNGYERSLEKILSLTEKDYWAQYVDVNRHQVNVAKTYLWVSAALLGAYTAFFTQYKTLLFNNSFCTIILATLSFLSAVIAFGVCLYAIPARKGYMAIAQPSWGEFSKNAHDLLSEKKKHVYLSLLTSLIDRIDLSNHHNVQTNNSRARLLRTTSWILVFSFLTATICSISLSLSNINASTSSTIKETFMVDKNDITKPSEVPQSPATTDKPDVPTPAGPIGSLPQNYTTHSLDPRNMVVRLTESFDKGGVKDGERVVRLTESFDKSGVKNGE